MLGGVAVVTIVAVASIVDGRWCAWGDVIIEQQSRVGRRQGNYGAGGW